MPGPETSERRRRTFGRRCSTVATRRGYPRRGVSLLGAGLGARAAAAAALGGRLALGLGLVGRVGVRGVGAARAHRVEAGLQRAHEVGHRRAGLLDLRLHGDLLAGGLALDEREHLLAVGVVVLVRLPLAGQRLDELLGDRELAVVGLRLAGGVELVDALGVDDLVGEDHRRHPEHVAVHGTDRDEALLLADDDAGDGDLARLAHRLQQQPVGLGATGAGREVVGVVVEQRVDRVEVDEVLDLDRPGLLRIERLELRRLDDDVAVRGDLIALDDLVVGHLLARRRVDALLLDAHARALVELVEAHRLAADRAVELDGDRDQPEADRTGPDRPRHGSYLRASRARGPPRTGGCAPSSRG